MEPAYFEHFPQGNWTELDDEAWQKLLEDMNPAAFGTYPAHDQVVQFEDPAISTDAASVYDQQARHSADTNAAIKTEYPTSPPGCVTLSSAETSPEAEPILRAVSEDNGAITVEDLRKLVDQLRHE